MILPGKCTVLGSRTMEPKEHDRGDDIQVKSLTETFGGVLRSTGEQI